MNRFAFPPTRAAALAALVLATGCSSYKLATPAAALAPFAAPPRDRAQICVLRDSEMAQAVTFPVRDGGVLVGATRGPGYFCYLAAPGNHAITIEADEVERAVLVAEPGGRYYLKQEVDNLFGYVKCRAVWVAEPVARELASDLDYLVLVGVPGSEKLPGEVPFAPSSGEAAAPAP